MAHLLHIDSSLRGDRSVSRKLTARARDAWLAAHPAGTVTYRDPGSDPLPYFDTATGLARLLPPGLPLYNFGAPSSIKTRVDHLIAPGLSHDPETKAPLLGGRELVVLASRGGGYAAVA